MLSRYQGNKMKTLPYSNRISTAVYKWIGISNRGTRSYENNIFDTMETNLSPDFRKWIRKCLTEEFKDTIDKNLEKDRNSIEVAQKVIDSREMTDLLKFIKTTLNEQKSRPGSAFPEGSRPQTSISCISDFSGDEWLSFKGSTDRYSHLVDKIDLNKPVHVRLSGYEALLKSELSGIFSIKCWDVFLKTLKDGILDESRPVFEASLQLFAKLLNSPQTSEIYGNLITAFNEQYQSRKINDILPTLISGVNFKVFLHEKLIRIMHLIIRHQEEVLKGIRSVDKNLEELIEQFVMFLSSNSFGSPVQIKILNPLNILSILEPEASWSGRWVHSLVTRKAFCNAISKSPSLLQTIIQISMKGLLEPPSTVSFSVSDDPGEVFISGETVEMMTYLHSLTLLTQLSSYSTGRALLSETQVENPFSVTDFIGALLTSLNFLASSEIPSAIYDVSRKSLRYILYRPAILYDARFYHIAFNPLMSCGDRKIYPHTLDVAMHMLDTVDGSSFMGSESRLGSASSEETSPNYPAVAVLEYTADSLRQPLSVMNIELVADLFIYIGRLMKIFDVYEITQETLEMKLYPAIAYFYSKLDKYALENEIKTQFLNSAAKNMLLKVVSMPLGLQILSREPVIFEELIRGSIGPLRASWSSCDVVSFISSSANFSLGVKVLSDLAPHVLSTLINELCKILKDPQRFYDPWEEKDVETFLHVLALFSLNTKCLTAFLTTSDETKSKDENTYPLNLNELFQHSINLDSEYHYLSLLSLKDIIWNLDIYIYLLNSLNLEEKLLNLQDLSIIEDEDYKTEGHENYMVDECSLLRHQILSDSYFVRHKRSEYIVKPEDCLLFSKMPPPQGPEEGFGRNSPSDSELEYFLQESIPGLRDSSWVSQARKTFKASGGSMKSGVMLDLLDQMQKAIPTVEWVDHFIWETNDYREDYWLPEDIKGIDLILRYAKLNGTIDNTEKAKSNLKLFIYSAHSFIKYQKPLQFDGFDWFLATIFIICNGDLEKSKICVTRIVRFPSAIFMWPALAEVVDQSNEEEATTRLLVSHLLEYVISKEFPTLKYAMKNKCGVDWWMICEKLSSQSFWGILPWNEIKNFVAICILYPPDYIIYYCVSLLNHCQNDFMQSATNRKMWPEFMILEDYRCHSQIGYMDRLGKRYSGKLLPILAQRKLNFPEADQC